MNKRGLQSAEGYYYVPLWCSLRCYLGLLGPREAEECSLLRHGRPACLIILSVVFLEYK